MQKKKKKKEKKMKHSYEVKGEGFLTLAQSAKLTRKANLLMRKKAELSCR